MKPGNGPWPTRRRRAAQSSKEANQYVSSADEVIAVFKFGQKKSMEELLHHGHVYMNPLSRFKKIDDGSLRFDPDEGTVYCKNVEGWTVEFEHEGSWHLMGNATGPLRMGDKALLTANLYCLHTRTRRDYGVPLELDKLNLGDTYVVFREPGEFFRRLDKAATEAGQKLLFGLIEYVDRAFTGNMGILRKFSKYSTQQELRVAALPGTGLPLSLWLGDLTDIALMGPTDKRIRLDPKADGS